MATIRIRDGKAPEHQLVYQGPVVTGCEPLLEEDSIMLWSMCELAPDSSAKFFLSPEEAKKLAKQLLNSATVIETGVAD